MNSSVYFIQAETGQIKIGYTTYLITERLNTLQVGCPVELKLLLTVPGTERLEKALHQKFAAFRIRGEWFAPDASLREFIESAINRKNGQRLLPKVQPGPKAQIIAEQDRPDPCARRVAAIIDASPQRTWMARELIDVLNDPALSLDTIATVLSYLYRKNRILRYRKGKYHSMQSRRYQLTNVPEAQRF